MKKELLTLYLHEIAHGLDYKNRGYSNHDSEWKRVARSIGCSGERCSSGSGVDKSQFMKWVATCPNCERECLLRKKNKSRKSVWWLL